MPDVIGAPASSNKTGSEPSIKRERNRLIVDLRRLAEGGPSTSRARDWLIHPAPNTHANLTVYGAVFAPHLQKPLVCREEPRLPRCVLLVAVQRCAASR